MCILRKTPTVMINQEQDTPEPTNAEISQELLKKSADLKERAADLKLKMDQTQKACSETLQSIEQKP